MSDMSSAERLVAAAVILRDAAEELAAERAAEQQHTGRLAA